MLVLKIRPPDTDPHLDSVRAFVRGLPGLSTSPHVAVVGIVSLAVDPHLAPGSSLDDWSVESLRLSFVAAAVNRPPRHNAPAILLNKAVQLVHSNNILRATGTSQIVGDLAAIDIPFVLSLSPAELRLLPPSVQLNLSSPSIGGPYGIKYYLKAVCNVVAKIRQRRSDDSSPSVDRSSRILVETRSLVWPDFRDLNVLAVLKTDILTAWIKSCGEQSFLSDFKDISIIRPNSCFSPSAFDLAMCLRKGSNFDSLMSSNIMKELPQQNIQNFVAMKSLFSKGTGNFIRMIKRDMPVKHEDNVVLSTDVGWTSFVEFDSDTVCCGDCRSVKFKIAGLHGCKHLRSHISEDGHCQRGLASFQLILIETWEWDSGESGSREILLLNTTESLVHDFEKEQTFRVKIPDFLQPSVQVPNVRIRHTICFKFTIPRVPLRVCGVGPDLDPLIFSLNERNGSNPTDKSRDTSNYIKMTAPIKVTAFSRSELKDICSSDILFKTLLEILPEGCVLDDFFEKDISVEGNQFSSLYLPKLESAKSRSDNSITSGTRGPQLPSIMRLKTFKSVSAGHAESEFPPLPVNDDIGPDERSRSFTLGRTFRSGEREGTSIDTSRSAMNGGAAFDGRFLSTRDVKLVGNLGRAGFL
ncbi:hypothetical protein HDU84_002122 [Entophlyctis sp. JEL0112]|nr:hypothetical protein HDU84_002122 [Entophlyctis sp. JEL0112]